MMMLKKSVKKTLGDLWLKRFDTSVHWKAGLLLRRHGPALVGIAIEPGNTERVYHPVFHIHNLGRERDDLTLSLAGRLVGRFGLSEEASRDPKEMEERSVFERFEKQYPLIANAKMSFNDYVATARNCIRGKHGHNLGDSIWTYHDILITAAWCGYKEYVLRNLERVLKHTKDWIDQRFQFVGGHETWREKIVALADDPTPIDQTIHAEVERHGLQDLPDHKLIVDKSPKDLL